MVFILEQHEDPDQKTRRGTTADLAAMARNLPQSAEQKKP